MPVKTSVVFKQEPDLTIRNGSYVVFEDAQGKKAVGIICATEAKKVYFDILVLTSESQFFLEGKTCRKSCLCVEPFYGKIEIEVT